MAIIKKFGDVLTQKLNTFRTFVTDANPNSEYFRITEFKETFTGGKNGFLIEGSQYLKESTEIKIQILDVNGNPIYFEPGGGIPEYYEGVSKLVAVYVYEDTPIGLANITILGELKQYIDDDGIERDIPDDWKNVYNVKWEKSFKVNRLIRNEDRVRFYRKPEVNITEIVKPLFSNVVSTITKSGSLNGIPLNPVAGTRLNDYRLPTSYLLRLNDGSAWTGSVVGTQIQIPSLTYTPLATDLVNNTDLVVSNPYTTGGVVSPFTSASYTASFNYVEGVDNLATALTGSFAKIKLTELTTFVGDVARVKVFRKSQSDLSDYQFIQEIQLESNEVLIDLESQNKNQEFYGLFDSNIITEYWVTSSNDITPSFNQTTLYNSVKLTNTGTNFYFTSKSLDITKDIEYTLNLNLRRESVQGGEYLKVFLSGSKESSVNGSPTTIQIQQNIINVSSDSSLLQKTNNSTNFKAEEINNAKLYFEVNGGPWYISDVSVRASQESSFSPDELTFIQPVPRTLPAETFDFLFQFYDINNNYIPVIVEESKTFDGGNLNAINKSIELVPSSLYFQFDSGSNGGNPVPPTTIFIDVVKNFLTGSTNFTSRSFDFFNNELSSSQYVGGVFPGLLEDFNLDTVKLTVQNFTGSVASGNPDIIVQFIQYTAECEGVEDSIIITRVQDGKGGVNYEIRPYNGTVIRNSDASSSLEVQAIRIDGVNEIKLRSGLEDNRSDYQLFVQSGSTYITLQEASDRDFVRGLSAGTTGSGELNYNAQFNRDSIDGQRTVYLIPSSSTNLSSSIITALTLTDLQDGLDAGVVLFDAEAFTINPRTQTLFTPIFSSATASFYKRGTFENPISCSFEVYPSMSINADFVPEYWMYFITHSCDPNIGVVAYDEFGNIIPSLPLGSYVGLAVSQSKQLLTSFTYTEPFTSASVNVDKLFSIIPEGKPGDESIVFEVNPQNVSLSSNSRGIVTDYSTTALDIKLKQGALYLSYTASQEPGTFNIAQQSIIGRNITQGYIALHGDYTASLRVSASSTMTDLSASIEFPLEIRPYYTSSVYTASVFQYITKVLDGPPPIEFIFSPQNVILQADEVGFVSDYGAGNTDIQVKEGDDFLTFTTQSNSSGTWRILSVTTTNIETGSLSSSSFDNATLTFNRFDYPYVSASAVYSIRVNPYSLGPGHQYTSSIYTRTQSFTKNVAPPAARGVSLISTAETVTFDGDGVVVSPLGDIRLTATPFNTTGSVYYQFFRDGSPYSAIQSDDFYDISSGDAVNPGQIATWRVDIRDGSSSPSAPIRAQAEVTIAGIQAGAEAYTVVLANENSSISADLWDIVLTGTGNTISAFKGTTQLIHTNSFSPKTQDLLGNDIGSLGEYQVTIHSVSGHLTPGSSLVSASILTTVGSSAVIGDLAGWTTPGLNQSGEIVYRVDIENGRQNFYKTQSFGVGIEAAAPYTVELSNQNAAIVYKVSGQLTTDGTGTTIRAFRGGTELNNASASFSTPQLDIYGNTGYKNQYRATVNSVPAYIDLAGAIVSGSELLSNPAQIGVIDGWTSPTTNLTGEVIYKIELEGRETIFKSQNFGIQLEGETGPGIVMRGQWNEVTNYIGSVETTNNRRDSVIYPDPSGSNGETHYFMALSGSGPGALDDNGVTVGAQIPPAPSNDTDYWKYLGQQDFFVSAKLAIFEESFVKNTINVGNNPGSSFANIVIAGGRTDPYLAIGQGGTQGAIGTSGTSVTGNNILGYDQPGIFLGMYENGGAGTTGRFSIKSAGGTAGTRGLFWDGDVLTIIGSIRQVQPGVNEGSLRGVWSSGLIYYPDDIVTYSDQTWVMTGATHTSTNDSNVSTGVPGSGPWTLAAAAGTSGAAARSVRLTSQAYVISYDADGNNPSPSGTIKLEASASNFNNGFFKFTGGGTNFSDEASYTAGTEINNDFASLTIPSSYFTGPLTFRVGVADGDQVEIANDSLSVVAVKPGADVSPQFMITPLSGTQIKNGGGSITLQVQQSDSTGLTDVTSGTGARLFKNDSSLLAVSMSGITDAGNGVAYNPTIDSDAITGTLILELRDVSDNILDTITLLDVTDGLGGGSFLAPTLQMTRINKTNTYTPSFLSATASFFATDGTEFVSEFRIFASASGVTEFTDNIYFDEGNQSANISYTANNGDGVQYVAPGFANSLPTKDINFVATFTDPNTNQTTTASETFYVVSDGADGIDAITVVAANTSHTMPAGPDGSVSDYTNSGIDILVYEGTASLSYDGVGTSAQTWTIGTPHVNPAAGITIGSITDGGYNAVVGDHSSMSNSYSLVTITYPITGSRKNGDQFLAEVVQSISKAIAGVNAKGLVITADSQVFAFDDPSDASAADDTIRIYIDQQNLSATVATTDITITPTGQSPFNPASLTGTVTSGTGQQYFDVTFSSTFAADKTRLPVTISVTKDSITDVVTLFKIEGGADSTPQYMITSIAGGTQIKNGTGTIELQVQKSDSTGLSDVTSGTDARIYDGASLIALGTGITDGGNGVVYNPIISSAAITGTKTFTLKDNSSNVLDSITLVDVSDGLGGGSFIATSLNTNRQPDNSYVPAFLSATASFFSVNGTEYTKAWRITPNLDSGTDYMYYDNDSGAHTDSEITFTVNNGDGTDYSGTGIGNKLPTKDINFVATFTDPVSSATNTITETFYIVSDGADGLDGLTIISTNQAHSAPASSLGVVSSYVGSGTTISVFEGITELSYDGVGTSNGTWTVSTVVTPAAAITVGSITDNGDNITVGDHSNMDNAEDIVTITYNISGTRTNSSPFTAASTQTITKAKVGVSGTSGTAGAAGSPGAGVVYRGEFAGTTGYFHTTTRRDVVRYAANYYLTANVGLNSSAGTDWGTPGASTSWESFGAQFSSVATDILLAQDVYADRTVNVGADGPNPVIQLYADYPTNANPAIKINLGTQGYSGTGGIFIGFDSATPKLSLVNSTNTKYLKWTGSDIDVKGTIRADAGVIGGFEITDSSISSSQYITSGSGTSFSAQPALALKANGQISGSAVRILRKSGNDFYTVMDTTNGILDAANLGRQVVSDFNEYEVRGIDTNDYVEVVSYPFNILPYENKISINYNLYGNKGGAATVAHAIRFTLEKHPTIGVNSLTSTFYDNWYDEQILTAQSQTLSAASEFSFTSPNSGSIYTNDIPPSSQNRFVHLKVLLLSNVVTGTANSSTVTKVKNISVITHRGFASAVATEIGAAVPDPGLPGPP